MKYKNIVGETYSWLFPGGTPATSTDKEPVVTYSQTGIYDVTLIVDRGSQVDTLVKPGYITVNGPVGMDPVGKKDIAVFPNPSDGKFTVIADGIYDVAVTDITGIVLFTATGNRGARNFNLDLSSGYYFVTIQNGRKRITERLVIK